ncbi:ABC transporter permease subunit [Streptomonospora wellingtoniae]|uniref:ABC transporter permease subunit n=1 Tax=Streptomonospora wellingtoniae TaxID=3075544 RepID=A0ABU2KPT5_9ACTN|nr:ABC transporter permease subunit [Streptomonospora sp. DSM 45055]MDT0301287.1 ABC transporter permease subunit [Streptomonospora sp. DSM 45055]
MNLAAIASEASKIRTLRSAAAALATLFALSAGLGAVSGWSVRRALDEGTGVVRDGFDPVSTGVAITGYGQFALIVFGVVIVGHEYTSGMIRQALTAVPRRGAFYSAKLVAGGAAALAVAVPSVLAGYLATQWGLGAHGTGFDEPEAARALAGAVAYLVLTTVFCIGVGTALRSPVAALAVLAPLYFFVSQLLTTLEGTAWFAKYLPDQAGIRMFAVGSGEAAFVQAQDPLSPAEGGTVLAAWACGAALLGYLRLRRLQL